MQRIFCTLLHVGNIGKMTVVDGEGNQFYEESIRPGMMVAGGSGAGG